MSARSDWHSQRRERRNVHETRNGVGFDRATQKEATWTIGMDEKSGGCCATSSPVSSRGASFSAGWARSVAWRRWGASWPSRQRPAPRRGRNGPATGCAQLHAADGATGQRAGRVRGRSAGGATAEADRARHRRAGDALGADDATWSGSSATSGTSRPGRWWGDRSDSTRTSSSSTCSTRQHGRGWLQLRRLHQPGVRQAGRGAASRDGPRQAPGSSSTRCRRSSPTISLTSSWIYPHGELRAYSNDGVGLRADRRCRRASASRTSGPSSGATPLGDQKDMILNTQSTWSGNQSALHLRRAPIPG